MCLCVRLSACFRKQGRVLFGWKSNLFHMKPGRGRICILCSRLAPWHCSKRERSQKRAVEQDRKELELLEETVWLVRHERCRHCASSPPLTYFYSGDEKSLKGRWFSHGVDSIRYALLGSELGLLKSSSLPHYFFFQQAKVPGGNDKWTKPKFPWISISASQELRAVNKSQKVAQQLSGWLLSFILRMHQFWLNVSLEETFFVWRTDWRELWKWQDCQELKKSSISLSESSFVFPFSLNCRLPGTLSFGVKCLLFPLCAHAINKHYFHREFESWWASMHATENNLRKPICIWKRDFNCIFQSRC